MQRKFHGHGLLKLHSFPDFENPALRNAEAAVDPVRVGGGGAAAAAEAPGQRQEDQPRGSERGFPGVAAFVVVRGATGQRGRGPQETPEGPDEADDPRVAHSGRGRAGTL